MVEAVAHRKAKVPEMEMTSMAQGSLNTGALSGTTMRVSHRLNRESLKGVSRREGKVMSGVPTVIYDVYDERNTGLPTGRETYW